MVHEFQRRAVEFGKEIGFVECSLAPAGGSASWRLPPVTAAVPVPAAPPAIGGSGSASYSALPVTASPTVPVTTAPPAPPAAAAAGGVGTVFYAPPVPATAALPASQRCVPCTASAARAIYAIYYAIYSNSSPLARWRWRSTTSSNSMWMIKCDQCTDTATAGLGGLGILLQSVTRLRSIYTISTVEGVVVRTSRWRWPNKASSKLDC